MLHSRHAAIAAAALLVCLVGCDRQEDAPATTSAPSAAVAEAPTSSTTVKQAETTPPDDDAEPVKLDTTGWPEQMAVETADPEPADDDEPSKPKMSADGVPLELNALLDESSKGESPNEDGIRRSLRKARKRHSKIPEPENKVVREELREAFYKDGELTLDPDVARKKQPRWERLAREAQAKEDEANSKPEDTEFVPTGDRRYSTFSVDVDTASYAISTGRMRRGYPPKTDTVRTEEWLNSFHYQHDVPDGETFSVAMEAGPSPLVEGEHLLRVNIAGKSVANADRPAAHLTFVIDVSGSMFGPDKIDLIKESLTYLLGQLRPDDTVAIVTFSKETGVLLWPTPATKTDKILAAIGAIEPGGSTDMEDGLKMGYAVAFRESHYRKGDIHRVVVLGDGRANVGARKVRAMLGPVSAAVDKGITLSTIGFGAREVNDQLLEQLAQNGNGNYTFIDSFKDARRIFGEQLCGTLHVIGKDAKVQLDFNTKRVKSWQLIGYENRRLDTKEFRDDAVDAGEVGAGHQVTALYRLVLKDGSKGRLATTRFRWKDPETDEPNELEVELSEVAPAAEVSPDFKFAAAVAGAAEHFRAPKDERPDFDFAKVRRLAEEGLGENPDDKPARLEFIELVRELEPLMK